MKKFLFLAVMLATLQVSAQQTATVYSDTTVNADTTHATFDVVPSKVKSFTVDLTKITGNIATSELASVAGYVLLQGSNTGAKWNDVNTDTLKLTNQSVNSKTWTITSTSYKSYRARIVIPTGTVTTKALFMYLRRTDE